MRLTLRTLLAYLDDTLPPAEARQIGLKVAENPPAQDLVDRIKRVTRRRGLSTPPSGNEGSPSDPNTVAEFLSDALPSDQVAAFEKTCLDSDVYLAEVASCHQILTLVLSEQVRVPPTARKRMYQLVKGRESLPDRKPGRTIPVGGVLEDHKPPAPDDTDAPFLLGMSAFSRSDSWSRTATRVGVLALMLLAFGFALWMAMPPAVQPRPEVSDTSGYAAVPKSKPFDNAAKARPKDKGEPKPPEKPEPKPEEKPKEKPEPKPAENPTLAEVAPRPRLPGEPLAPVVNELVPKEQPPNPDRAVIGRLEKPTAVVVRPQGDGWVRVPPGDPTVVSSVRHIALPGYKTRVNLDSDVAVELWGNLPELFRAPVLEASITPYVPPAGFDADLTVHAGRVYLTTKKPDGAKVRLRFRDQVWDLTLADDKTEAVLEVVHTLVPGPQEEPPRTTVGFAVLAGQAALRPTRYQEAVKLTKGGDAFWDSKAGRPVVRPDPGEDVRKQQSAYLSRLQPYYDASQATLALEALADFANKLADGQRVRATFDEALQARPDAIPTPKDVQAARIAVLVFAALGDLSGLADGISDPNRPRLRQTAAEGLRAALAREPALVAAFRQTLVDKLRIEDKQADAILRLLRGFTDAERSDPATVDRLIGDLSSPAVAVRELAFQHLIGYIDLTDKANEPLLQFNAGAPSEYRVPAVQAWRKKTDEIKMKLTESPEKK
ncbi:MAG TPA: hypothetical protein VFG68_00005 [Fimbriiglobus sp.]|nr:hypothetical protein [Fimbriiglobus sp.]